MMERTMSRNFAGLEVQTEIGGVEYNATLEEDIEIDPSDLDAEFVEQPRKFAWWAMVCELAKDQLARRKYDLEKLYAVVDADRRMDAVKSKVKKTERMIENEVITDKRYQQAKLDMLDAKRQHGILYAGKQAFEQRKEMLISLGANYRAEGNADPVLLQETAKAKAADHARRRAASKSSKKKPTKKPTTKPKRKPFKR